MLTKECIATIVILHKVIFVNCLSCHNSISKADATCLWLDSACLYCEIRGGAALATGVKPEVSAEVNNMSNLHGDKCP